MSDCASPSHNTFLDPNQLKTLRLDLARLETFKDDLLSLYDQNSLVNSQAARLLPLGYFATLLLNALQACVGLLQHYWLTKSFFDANYNSKIKVYYATTSALSAFSTAAIFFKQHAQLSELNSQLIPKLQRISQAFKLLKKIAETSEIRISEQLLYNLDRFNTKVEQLKEGDLYHSSTLLNLSIEISKRLIPVLKQVAILDLYASLTDANDHIVDKVLRNAGLIAAPNP